MTTNWVATSREREYQLDWGESIWTLKLAADRPGLYGEGLGLGPLLALYGLCSPGRTDRAVFSATSLVHSELHFEGVQATYKPAGWGGMTVRATWRPTADHALDLEIQVDAQSVGELQQIELLTMSELGQDQPSAKKTQVVPRDAEVAHLSFDGREAEPQNLNARPPRSRGLVTPWFAADPLRPDWTYAEFAHPHDESRSIHQGRCLIQHALLGYDLEKGVLLRARLRGLWLSGDDPIGQAGFKLDRFLAEPPPLSSD